MSTELGRIEKLELLKTETNLVPEANDMAYFVDNLPKFVATFTNRN